MIRTVKKVAHWFLGGLASVLVRPGQGSVNLFAAKRTGGTGEVLDGRFRGYMKGIPQAPEDIGPQKRVDVPAKLWSVLDEIPREGRQIFVLFHIERSSCEEIAHFLGLPEESVKAHLSKAEGHVRERVPWIKLAELTVSEARHQRLLQQIMARLPTR